MQINNLIETIRLKYNPEENIITIYNLNLHTERLLNSIAELNFKINKKYIKADLESKTLTEYFYKSILEYISEKLLIFFTENFHNIDFLDKKINNFNLTDYNIQTFTGSFNYDNQEKNIYKLRLIYNIDGEIKREISLYDRFLENNIIKFTIAKNFKINSEDKKWRHKFFPREEISLNNLISLETRRNELNTNVNHVNKNTISLPDINHELIWTNEKDEICEGSFTNIFFRKNNQWLTPHIDSNLLNGTMRKILINELEASEKKTSIYDLETADEIILCNSMLGKVRAELQ
ncbi:MAG: aminotransferase class IV [Vampirovibrionia bacterium]|jgi:4-amino-4-deoxychorismate lyase